MTQQRDWGAALHQRLAAAIRNARQGRMSAQELADETARLGYPVSRSQIANYESGRKQSLDVAELLVLAAALDVPPALLLFPGYPLGDVEFLPARTAEAAAAVDWFSGSRPLPTGPGDSKIDRDNAGTEIVSLVREFGQNAKLFKILETRSLMMDAADERMLAHQDEVKEHLQELRAQIDKLSPMFDITEESQ